MTLAKPPRLERIFQKYDPPLFFVTICTRERRKVLANEAVHAAFIEFGKRGTDRSIVLGRNVVMPDHIHFFVRGTQDFDLGKWVRGLKRVVAAAVPGGRNLGEADGLPALPPGTAAATTAADHASIWQRGFFDHLLRHSESYTQKWEYVCQNPVRAGLVTSPAEWPFQGEITPIDRA